MLVESKYSMEIPLFRFIFKGIHRDIHIYIYIYIYIRH